MLRNLSVYRFLFTGKWIAGFIFAVIFSLICVYLAGWQMGRKEELDYRNSLITDNYDAQPYRFADDPSLFSDFKQANLWHPVEMRGHYLTENQLLVRNRPYEGLNGFEVLVPFETVQGNVVVIDRGWLVADDMDASKPAGEVPAPPAGEVTVTARVHNGEMDTGKSAIDGQVASIHLPTIAALTGLDVDDQAYGQLVSEDPAAAVTPEPFVKPDLDTGPNLSYSVQWYVFAAGAYVAFAWLARQKVRNDELDAQVAAELDAYYSQFYDAEGNYIGEEDESVILRKMEMVDDMPAHMKAIVRPKLAKKRSQPTDEELEDAYLDSLEKLS